MAAFFAEITLVQSQGICEEKESNHESFGVQSSDFPCGPFLGTFLFLVVGSAQGELGKKEQHTLGNVGSIAGTRGKKEQHDGDVGGPVIFSLFLPIGAEIAA